MIVTFVVDAVHEFRRAFLETDGQVAVIIDVRAHDGVRKFVGDCAVEGVESRA